MKGRLVALVGVGVAAVSCALHGMAGSPTPVINNVTLVEGTGKPVQPYMRVTSTHDQAERCRPPLGALLTPARMHQDMRPLVESADTHYYDFWIGTWAVARQGVVEPGGTTFSVTKSIHAAAFEETWGGASVARAFRTWDKTTHRWMYVWLSANGLFQVWEGRKVGNDWYMFKEFDLDGDRYLSRQAVLPWSEGSAVRISERSTDGGRTWQLRFREELRRIAE